MIEGKEKADRQMTVMMPPSLFDAFEQRCRWNDLEPRRRTAGHLAPFVNLLSSRCLLRPLKDEQIYVLVRSLIAMLLLSAVTK